MLKSLLTTLALLASTTLALAKTVVIDVRTPAEYAQGHVEGSINIDHTEIASRIGETRMTKDDTIILYCRSGRRSGLAQDTLQKMGFAHVQNYGSLEEARQKLQKK